MTVRCDVAKGASKYLGIKSDGEGKSFKVEMKKTDTYLQVGITNLNEESLTYYYWNFKEAGSSLILSPGDDMTKGYPTLTITPEGASTKIVRTGGDLAFFDAPKPRGKIPAPVGLRSCAFNTAPGY